MKLYYGPGACSLAPHIVAREAGIELALDKIDWKNRVFESGEKLDEVNPKGYIPVIQLDDGSTFTETGTMIQYLADLKPDSKLAPAAGTQARYRLMEWINFVSTELHKGFGPLWRADNPQSVKDNAIAALNKRFAYLDAHFAKHAFLMGDAFTAVDAYLFTIVNWINFHQLSIATYPRLADFMARVAARPAVQAAMRAEGLVK